MLLAAPMQLRSLSSLSGLSAISAVTIAAAVLLCLVDVSEQHGAEPGFGFGHGTAFWEPTTSLLEKFSALTGGFFQLCVCVWGMI